MTEPAHALDIKMLKNIHDTKEFIQLLVGTVEKIIATRTGSNIFVFHSTLTTFDSFNILN